MNESSGVPGGTVLWWLSAPKDGREAEYIAWYDDVHLGEVLAIPGFVPAQRYRLERPLAAGAPAMLYLAIYDIAAEDAAAPPDELRRRAGAGELAMSDAIDLARIQAVVYAPIGSPRTG